MLMVGRGLENTEPKMFDSFVESECKSFSESNLNERGNTGNDDSFELQTINGVKKWIGNIPRWLGTSGSLPTYGTPKLWTPSERSDIRKRYALGTITGNYASIYDTSISDYRAFSYTTHHELIDPGQVPNVDDTYLGDSSWNISATEVSIVNGSTITSGSAVNLNTFTSGGLTSATLSNGSRTITCELSLIQDFADSLAIGVSEITGMSFSTFSDGHNYGLRWDEYSNTSTSYDPSTYDGNPYEDATLTGFNAPFFGANDVVVSTNESSLWSGWYFSATEEGSNELANLTTLEDIRLRRCRFRSSKLLRYFFAFAIVTRNPLINGVAQSEDDLTGVKVIKEGSVLPGQILEVPFPSTSLPGLGSQIGIDDFVTVALPVRSDDTLSCGAMVFCILGESPSDWSARTGIEYT